MQITEELLMKSLEERIKYLEDNVTDNRAKASAPFWSWCADTLLDIIHQTEYRLHLLKEQQLWQNYQTKLKGHTSQSTSRRMNHLY